MIKPDAYLHVGSIIQEIQSNGFNIVNCKMVKLSKHDACQFYGEHQGKPFYDNLTNYMSSDFIVALELVSDDAIKKWRELIGPTNSLTAKEQAP